MSEKLRKIKDRASRAFMEGRNKEALKLYAQVVEEDPTELACQIKIGDIHRKLGQRKEAVEAYEPVAVHYAEDGLLLKAIAVCKLILSVDAAHTSTQEMLANLYSKREGRIDYVPRARAQSSVSPQPAMQPSNVHEIELDEGDEQMIVERSAAPGTPQPQAQTMWPPPANANDAVKVEPMRAPVTPMFGWPVSQAPQVIVGAKAEPPPSEQPKVIVGKKIDAPPPVMTGQPVAPPPGFAWPVAAGTPVAPPQTQARGSGRTPSARSEPIEVTLVESDVIDLGLSGGESQAEVKPEAPAPSTLKADFDMDALVGAVADEAAVEAGVGVPDAPDEIEQDLQLASEKSLPSAPAQAPPPRRVVPQQPVPQRPVPEHVGPQSEPSAIELPQVDEPLELDVRQPAPAPAQAQAQAQAPEPPAISFEVDAAAANAPSLFEPAAELAAPDAAPSINFDVDPAVANAPSLFDGEPEQEIAIEAPIEVAPMLPDVPVIGPTLATNVIIAEEEEPLDIRLERDISGGSIPAVDELDRPIELNQIISTPSRPTPRATVTDDLGVLGIPQIPLFSDLPKEAFISILVEMQMRELGPGEYVIREGEIGNSFFVLATGRVRVSRKGNEVQETILAYLTDGAFFGEMALLQDGARTASVIVEEDSQIFELDRPLLDRIVAQYPSVARVLRNFYMQRLLSTTMATHPLFRSFSLEDRRGLMERFKSRGFKSGDTLVHEAQKGEGLYLCLTGTLEVTKVKDGQPIVIAEINAGDMFGEMSLLSNRPTIASVTAVSDCFVLRLAKKDFDEVIMTHPQVLELIAKVSEERQTENNAIFGAWTPRSEEGAALV